ncbi:MAG: FAD-dependent oxidoreductase, partial [Spirochaetia bacterium]|nr:FAD-dependent oxidoreductase [Spirochaetia bacterium]
RIIGEYTLTIEDLRTGRMPEDVIALSGYPVDIHSPDGKSVNLEHVPRYGIPFRTLIPKGLNNVLVAGRSLSATHEALASVRVMAPCMAMGQAAGTAAAMALKEILPIRNISIPALQQQLRNQGAILGV